MCSACTAASSSTAVSRRSPFPAVGNFCVTATWMLFWTMLRWRDRFDGLQMQMWLGTMVCRCGLGYWQSELMYISPRITGRTQKSMHSHMRVCAGSQLQMWLGTMERVIGRSGHFRHWSQPQCHPNAKH